MDALLSLPLISYLLIPGTTSWSTSLNLFFFTMTWTTLTVSYPPLRIELIAVLTIRLAFWFIPSVMSLLLDLLVPSLASQLKHRGESALPPRDFQRVAQVSGLALTNLALSLVTEGVISYGLASLIGHPIFAVSVTPPLPWNLIKHVILLLAGREFITYHIHRYLLHTPTSNPVAQKLTKLHTSAIPHSRSSPPYSLLLFADHPIPALFLRFLPLYLPALALGPHLLTYLVFVFFATLEETSIHSGYSVVPGILLGGMARRCAIHYCGGRGNFGAWGLLDWAYGTSAGGQDVIGDLKDEAEKHNLPQKGQSVANSAAKKL